VARFRKSAGKDLKPLDRVVLQILFSGGKELFASPGDTHWETNPFAFVASGMMSNGLFALNLKTVFLDNHSIIRYKGDEFPTGRREVRYDFTISRMSSGYTIQNAGASGVAEFRWPEGPCVAFLFNPFGAAVMRRVLAALAKGFAGRAGELDLLYVNNEQERVLERQAGLVRVFLGEVRRSRADAIADHKILANQPEGEYASANAEDCSIWRWGG
jgi:hypothetical protein